MTIKELINKDVSYDSTQDTMTHKEIVSKVMGLVIEELVKRAEEHDNSKLIDPEKSTYDKYIPKLKPVKYGSPEYDKLREEMRETGLGHHAKSNRHHPEHFENGVEDMTIIDLVEMLVDWISASKRSDTGFLDGLTRNVKKYNISPQLEKIFINTYSNYANEL